MCDILLSRACTELAGRVTLQQLDTMGVWSHVRDLAQWNVPTIIKFVEAVPSTKA